MTIREKIRNELMKTERIKNDFSNVRTGFIDRAKMKFVAIIVVV